MHETGRPWSLPGWPCHDLAPPRSGQRSESVAVQSQVQKCSVGRSPPRPTGYMVRPGASGPPCTCTCTCAIRRGLFYVAVALPGLLGRDPEHTRLHPTSTNGSNSGTCGRARTLSERLPPSTGGGATMQPNADRLRITQEATSRAHRARTSAHLIAADAVGIRSHGVCAATQDCALVLTLRAQGMASHNAVDSKNSVCIIRSRSTARKARDCSGIFSFSAVGQKLSRPQGSRHTASCAVLERAA